MDKDNVEKVIAQDCVIQHFNTFIRQSHLSKQADFGEACSKCKHIEKCKCDWTTAISPLLKESSINFK